MSGAVLVSRLILRVVRSLSCMDEKPRGTIPLLDSECTICTLEAKASQLKPFMHNRRAEFIENMDAISKFCPVEPPHWIASADNPADMLTRGTAKLSDIGLDSTWQRGPKFFSLPREEWPVSRDCVSKKIPSEKKIPTIVFQVQIS